MAGALECQHSHVVQVLHKMNTQHGRQRIGATTIACFFQFGLQAAAKESTRPFYEGRVLCEFCGVC
tara:strand:+ start:1591 stop:1788 length:198 start_codon:yes stop_codon:yes gene_type:complete